MALSFGCGIEDLIDDLRSELNSDTDFAPTSLAGKTFQGTVNSGTGGLLNTGSFTITFTGTSFSLVDSAGNDSGTYTYTKTGANLATAVLNSVDGDSTTATITFPSPTSGSYSAVKTTGAPGTQTGTFIMN